MTPTSTIPSKLTNANGRVFTVRVVRKGDRYGLDHCLVNESATMVEFYDATYAGKRGFDREGQFVSRYFVSTLLEDSNRLEAGLSLDGGIVEWTIDGEALAPLLVALRNLDLETP